MRIEHEHLNKQVREAKHQAAIEAAGFGTDNLAAEFAVNGLTNLSPEKTERLLAELGFNWNSPGDYLIVSKKSLRDIGLSAVRDVKLTDAVRAALVIIPTEQSKIETEVQQTSEEYKSWALTHASREEPSGNVLAKYSLESDPQFSQSLSNGFAAVIDSTLGDERGALFRQYAANWMDSLGMFGAGAAMSGANRSQTETTTMTIRRDRDYLMLDLRQGNGSMSCGISPGQPFPEAFRPLFPGGWKDLAEREGFELPPEFQTK